MSVLWPARIRSGGTPVAMRVFECHPWHSLVERKTPPAAPWRPERVRTMRVRRAVARTWGRTRRPWGSDPAPATNIAPWL